MELLGFEQDFIVNAMARRLEVEHSVTEKNLGKLRTKWSQEEAKSSVE